LKPLRPLSYLIFFLLAPVVARAQYPDTYNLPNYDEKPIHYGFLVAPIHFSNFEIKHSPAFLDSVNLHSIMPRNSAGFSLGFIGNLRLGQYFDFRLTPTVGFYEIKMDYNYLDRGTVRQSVSSTNLELPLLIKYKSKRRKNTRMYLIAGTKVSLEASGRNEEDEDMDRLRIKDTNVFAEFGFGLDIYYPLFKFSPEIRFSHGLLDVLDQTDNQFTTVLDRVSINTVTLFLIVQ